MGIFNRNVVASVFLASCPDCSEGQVVLGRDIKRNEFWSCQKCGHRDRLSEFDVEHSGDFIIVFSVDGIKIKRAMS